MQITFSNTNMNQARFVYDQFHIISPFFVAISATTCFLANRLLDTDSRLDVLQQSTDDRTLSERHNNVSPKYSYVQHFISNDVRMKHEYNNNKYLINKKFKRQLKKVLKNNKSPFQKDKRLLNHFGYLFNRENYLQLIKDIKEDYDQDTVNYETIQGQNWNNVRIKVPFNYRKDFGWLVEFRAMDCLVLNCEKAAMVSLVKLFHRMIINDRYKVNFYIPMTLVNENMDKAQGRDAILHSRIWVRRYFSEKLHSENYHKDEYILVTFLQYIQGCKKYDGMYRLF